MNFLEFDSFHTWVFSEEASDVASEEAHIASRALAAHYTELAKAFST